MCFLSTCCRGANDADLVAKEGIGQSSRSIILPPWPFKFLYFFCFWGVACFPSLSEFLDGSFCCFAVFVSYTGCF